MAVPCPPFPRCSGRFADADHEILDAGGHENWTVAATRTERWLPTRTCWAWEEASQGGQSPGGSGWSGATSGTGPESWPQSSAHLVQQLVDQDELLAAWAGATGAQQAAEQIAVRAAPLVEVALLALGALVDPGPARRQAGGWGERRERRSVATSVGPRPARPGAEPGPGRRYLGVADRALAASWAI